MSGSSATNDRSVAFFTALIAVLAALGTLFSHHRSIVALSIRNEALALTAQASDQYGYYQAEQLKVTLFKTLRSLDAGGNREKLDASISGAQRSSLAILARAKTLESHAGELQEHAGAMLTSFETLEIATTLFEISIAFASIAALTHLRLTLVIGIVLSAIGLVIGVYGFFQAH